MTVDKVNFNPDWVARFESAGAFIAACDAFNFWPRLTDEARKEKLTTVYNIVKNIPDGENSSRHDGEPASLGCEQPDTAKPNGRKGRNGRTKQATDVEGASGDGATD